MADEKGTEKSEKRFPYTLSSTGWAFFAMGLPFFIIGVSSNYAFMAMGLVFMVLAFAMGDGESEERPSEEGEADPKDPEGQPGDSEDRGGWS